MAHACLPGQARPRTLSFPPSIPPSLLSHLPSPPSSLSLSLSLSLMLMLPLPLAQDPGKQDMFYYKEWEFKNDESFKNARQVRRGKRRRRRKV